VVIVSIRLLEQNAGHVQQLVIDPEGEFATLREKHDYVIAAAHDGDALAYPKPAQILARRLLETGVSVNLDIYDLKAHERQAFVRIFCEALVNAPKALWQPTLIVLDEAHVYCPEAGEAESAGAVIDIATRGRERGSAMVAVTQRFAEEAAAEARSIEDLNERQVVEALAKCDPLDGPVAGQLKENGQHE
jgi:DNA helicase HerA-like ATPase